MLRLLSWNACDRFAAPDMRIFTSKHETASDMLNESSPIMKRKRSIGDDNAFASVPSVSHAEQEQSRMANPVSSVNNFSNSILTPQEGLPTPLLSPKEVKMEDSNLANKRCHLTKSKEHALRQTIQIQLNLEILLKHKELRLIDQEIAKCQVALEQLRRATEIPYPATQYAAEVSLGQGSAVRTSFTGRLPASPAPWGVTDGPYSRHYSKWLLEDARFDGGELDTPMTTVSGETPILGRTRGSFIEHTHYGIKSRSQQRGGKLKSLPAGYGQPKEKATGPMILKRKSDGVMVKLVCPDCGRHDFGSAQGFINHCRIGHGRNFASHDAAAEGCGEPVEYDQSGAMVGVEPVVTPVATSVHPLIRSAKMLQTNSVLAAPIPDARSPNSKVAKARQAPSPEFRASMATPNLSELVKNKGLGLNLQDMVTDAKMKVELPESDGDESEVETELPMTQMSRGKHPQVAGTKQLSKPVKAPANSPILNSRMPVISRAATVAQLDDDDAVHFSRRRSSQLVDQSTTGDSNQAPSLIDDDEEYDAHSPATVSVTEDTDEGDVEFAVQDDDENRHTVLPRPEIPTTCTHTAGQDRVRRPSALRQEIEHREEKHVSFVAENLDTDTSEPNNEDRNKRRKLNKS